MTEANASFVVNHADFWLDSDGTNRWTFAAREGGPGGAGGNPSYGHSHCQACGHFIMEIYEVVHPVRGICVVGNECINQIKLTLGAIERAKIELAMAKFKRAAKLVKAKKVADRLRELAGDPELQSAYYQYGTKEIWEEHNADRWVGGRRIVPRMKNVASSCIWYAGELERGKNYAQFWKALKAAILEKGKTV
jgi:hypothetical protein